MQSTVTLRFLRRHHVFWTEGLRALGAYRLEVGLEIVVQWNLPGFPGQG